MPVIFYGKRVTTKKFMPITPEDFRGMMADPAVAAVYAAIARLDEDLAAARLTQEEFDEQKAAQKRRLPVVCFMASFAGDGTRSNANAVPTGLVMMDYDHLPGSPTSFFETYVRGREAELLIALAHVTPSGHGLRLVACLLPGEAITTAQKRLHASLGCTQAYDLCVKDLARVSFMFPRHALLYYDEALLFAPDLKAELAQRGITPPQPAAMPAPAPAPATPAQPQAEAQPQVYPQEFKGLPFASIISRWFEEQGGEPVEGERHTMLMKLASELRHCCENNPQWLLQLLPSYGLPAPELARICQDACAYPLLPTQPRQLRQALIALQSMQQPSLALPDLPADLPPLIELLTRNVPDFAKPAVATCVFPALATYPRSCSARYIDGSTTPLGLMALQIATSSTAKSAAKRPIEGIMSLICGRDQAAREQEQAWKDEVNRAAANSAKRQRPKLPVQWISADLTPAAFAQRLQDAEGRHLFCQLSELQQLYALKSNTGKNGHLDILRLSFDADPWGQERVGTQSVTALAPLRLNLVASTTPTQAKQFFKPGQLADGALSRLSLCSIPNQPLGAPIPLYGTYGEAWQAELQPFIENLDEAEGEIACPEAFRLAKELNAECASRAQELQSEAYDYLRRRAVVIAYRKALLLWLAGGRQWQPEIESFIRWSVNYDLACKMLFSGQSLEKELREEKLIIGPPRAKSPLLAKLPDEFTCADLARVRQAEGRPEKGTKNLLKQWVHRGYIAQVTRDIYKKL